MGKGLAVIQGEKVAIEFQISNGDETKFPRAVIRDPNENVLDTRDLSHSIDGIYRPTVDYQMPAHSFIEVQYLVFDNAGRTVKTLDVGRDVDVFNRDLSAGGAFNNPNAQLVAEIVTSGDLVAIINEDEELVASLTDDSLTASLIADDDLVGTISNDDLESILEC